MKSICINGNKLADYLKKHNVSQMEFIEVINQSEPYAVSVDESEEEYYLAQDYSFNVGFSLFERQAFVDFSDLLKMAEHLGFDVILGIIDWEVMGYERRTLQALFSGNKVARNRITSQYAY